MVGRDFESGFLMEDNCRRTPQSALKTSNMDCSNSHLSPYLTPKILDRNFNLDCISDENRPLDISNVSSNMQHVVTMQNGFYNNNE